MSRFGSGRHTDTVSSIKHRTGVLPATLRGDWEPIVVSRDSPSITAEQKDAHKTKFKNKRDAAIPMLARESAIQSYALRIAGLANEIVTDTCGVFATLIIKSHDFYHANKSAIHGTYQWSAASSTPIVKDASGRIISLVKTHSPVRPFVFGVYQLINKNEWFIDPLEIFVGAMSGGSANGEWNNDICVRHIRIMALRTYDCHCFDEHLPFAICLRFVGDMVAICKFGKDKPEFGERIVQLLSLK